MQSNWSARAVILLGSVLAVAGCTTTQPDSIGTRTASLRMITKADADIFDCWEVWADADNDGFPEFLGTTECYPATAVPANRNVPWRYSMSISVIRAGTTNEEIVTSLSGLSGSSVEPNDRIDDFISLTDYDPTAQDIADGPTRQDPNFGTIYLMNGKRVSNGGTIYLDATGIDVGVPNILDAVPTFDFQVDSGDTVVVRARKQPVGSAPQFLRQVPDPNIELSGVLSISGAQVTPNGIPKSSIDDGAGISFSFTVH